MRSKSALMRLSGKQHAIHGGRVFIDEAVRGAGDERQVAGLQRAVDGLDGRAGGDEAQAQQVGERRAIGREQRRKLALIGQADVSSAPVAAL